MASGGLWALLQHRRPRQFRYHPTGTELPAVLSAQTARMTGHAQADARRSAIGPFHLRKRKRPVQSSYAGQPAGSVARRSSQTGQEIVDTEINGPIRHCTYESMY